MSRTWFALKNEDKDPMKGSFMRYNGGSSNIYTSMIRFMPPLALRSLCGKGFPS